MSRTPPPIESEIVAVDGHVAWGIRDVTHDAAALDSTGWWLAVLRFDGAPTFVRFAEHRATGTRPAETSCWSGPARESWTSSLDRDDHAKCVSAIREAIAAGDVYQVNLTRVLRAPLPPGASMLALGAELERGNPAPHGAIVELPSIGLRIASASPESFLSRRGRIVRSSPIKGTSAPGEGFGTKDRAENVMIVDLVRNDLGRVCTPGSVSVPSLLSTETHPGLDHLVSTVEGQLRSDVGWSELLDATFPAGSISGAPKISALEHIRALEPTERSIYCGAIGWVDADRHEGELNVAIRTFWVDGEHLCFGTGGAITWDSDADDEWRETELKAGRLLDIASAPTSR